MKSVLIGASLSVSLALAGSAQAQQAETVRDMRCAAAIAFMAAQSGAPDASKDAAMGLLYFLGRVEGREPGMALEPAFKATVATMTEADIQTDLVRCGAALSVKGKELQVIGKSLQDASAAAKPVT
ncbi:hypothetical protein [Phenylobacterium sp.]|uniref:hypothetical protein n=1 Tax=Phenylobacterium sp. TaxID=1871053 RepID=UPI00286C36BA|nr:hypothetical protein [Phenylobacterium sp.]